MHSPATRRVLDIAPLIVGIVLVVVPGTIAIVRMLTAPRLLDVLTPEELIRQSRVDVVFSIWTGYGLPVIGLVLIAYWIGRRVGRTRPPGSVGRSG